MEPGLLSFASVEQEQWYGRQPIYQQKHYYRSHQPHPPQPPPHQPHPPQPPPPHQPHPHQPTPHQQHPSQPPPHQPHPPQPPPHQPHPPQQHYKLHQPHSQLPDYRHPTHSPAPTSYLANPQSHRKMDYFERFYEPYVRDTYHWQRLHRPDLLWQREQEQQQQQQQQQQLLQQQQLQQQQQRQQYRQQQQRHRQQQQSVHPHYQQQAEPPQQYEQYYYNGQPVVVLRRSRGEDTRNNYQRFKGSEFGTSRHRVNPQQQTSGRYQYSDPYRSEETVQNQAYRSSPLVMPRPKASHDHVTGSYLRDENRRRSMPPNALSSRAPAISKYAYLSAVTETPGWVPGSGMPGRTPSAGVQSPVPLSGYQQEYHDSTALAGHPTPVPSGGGSGNPYVAGPSPAAGPGPTAGPATGPGTGTGSGVADSDSPQVVHRQYNSPMNVYSTNNVAEAIEAQTGFRVEKGQGQGQADGPAYLYSATARLVAEEDAKRQPGARGRHVKFAEHNPVQSSSFNRLQYSQGHVY